MNLISGMCFLLKRSSLVMKRSTSAAAAVYVSICLFVRELLPHIALQPLERFVLVRKRPIRLRLVGRGGDFADMPAGLVVEIRQHLPAPNNRRPPPSFP